ncbi:hypothetical protein HAX54_042841 [Datura stramonium]|uniref:Uncharacterized protein n=1 Tax=Datura stramonium TaxID=4076 RepID=A0ABS8W009_DATST|nr:hypothetical protein [Datura stramonium]
MGTIVRPDQPDATEKRKGKATRSHVKKRAPIEQGQGEYTAKMKHPQDLVISTFDQRHSGHIIKPMMHKECKGSGCRFYLGSNLTQYLRTHEIDEEDVDYRLVLADKSVDVTQVKRLEEIHRLSYDEPLDDDDPPT